MMCKFIKFSLSIFTAVLLIMVAVPADLHAQTSAGRHTVQEGETIRSIAEEYDLSVEDILRWNQLVSDDVSEGQVLSLGPPESDNRITHTVEAGETLFSISRRYDVTIAEIQQWNNIDGTNLETGQDLVLYPENSRDESEMLPPATQQDDGQETENEPRESIVRVSDSSPGNAYYTVRSGDTLTKIAREHNMTVSELRQLNDMGGDEISVGQRITVRDTHSTPSVAESSEESTPQGKFVIHRVGENENGETLLEKFQMNETEFNALNPGVEVSGISPGQRVTLLLPPNRVFENPYRKGSNLEDLGNIHVFRYPEKSRASSTTSGELYNPDQLTAAHPNMALGNIIYVENPSIGQGVYVRINDRHSDEGLKLSHKAFEMLGFRSDTGQVKIYLDQ